MADVDALAGPEVKRKQKEKPEDIGTVSDFIEVINATVGKHFKCCICFRSVCDLLPLTQPSLSGVNLPTISVYE